LVVVGQQDCAIGHRHLEITLYRDLVPCRRETQRRPAIRLVKVIRGILGPIGPPAEFHSQVAACGKS
jgi:hypothetical protein